MRKHSEWRFGIPASWEELRRILVELDRFLFDRFRDVVYGTGADDDRIAVWSSANEVEGDANLTWDGAELAVTSTTGGVLFPRMTTTQRNAISSPTDGLVIYNTTDSKLQVRAGAAWVNLH